mmetsp:Transcript_24797/g.40113  ORF Transcript_24797/g.40113 Transcript_24797/m.40113 type:complete len:129 (-) Transcript_24797:446-832(-)
MHVGAAGGGECNQCTEMHRRHCATLGAMQDADDNVDEDASEDSDNMDVDVRVHDRDTADSRHSTQATALSVDHTCHTLLVVEVAAAEDTYAAMQPHMDMMEQHVTHACGCGHGHDVCEHAQCFLMLSC